MNFFTKHPHSIGESYFEHLKVALSYGFKMVLGGIACIIHAFIPFLFESTASKITVQLYEHINKRQHKQS